jgi:outer membrane receptor for ferrienterochelin and colicin
LSVLGLAAMFAEHIWSPADGLELTTGVRQSYDRYLDEWHTEPRLSGRMDVSRNLSLHSSVGRYHQAPDPEQMV